MSRGATVKKSAVGFKIERRLTMNPGSGVLRKLRVMARYAPIAVLFPGVYFLRNSRADFLHGWQGTGWSYLFFFFLIALSIGFFKCIPPASPVPVRWSRVAYCSLATVLAFLFAAKYLYNINCIPLALTGESLNAPWESHKIWHELSRGSFNRPEGYGLGMAYLYLPFYAIWGQSIWATKALYLICWGIAMGALVFVWRKQFGHEGMVSMLLVIATLSYGLSVERRYKWHMIAVLVAASIFVVESSFRERGGARYYLLLALVLGLGLLCYHGCVIYALFVMVLVGCRPGREGGSIRWLRSAGLLLLFAFSGALLFFILFHLDRLFLYEKLEGLWIFFRDRRAAFWLSQELHLTSFFTVFFDKMNYIASLAFVAGLGAAVADFRKMWVARYALVGFTLTAVFLLPFFPLTNYDEAHYIIVFVYLLVAYGIYALLLRLNSQSLRVAAVVLCSIYMTATEWGIYRRDIGASTCMTLTPENFDTQGIVALYDATCSEDPSTSTVFFPEPYLPGELGGFGNQAHTDALRMREYAAWSGNLHYFGSMEALRRGVARRIAQGEGERKRVVAYVSPNVDRQEMEKSLQGLKYRLSEPSCFEAQWGVRIPVCKLQFFEQ